MTKHVSGRIYAYMTVQKLSLGDSESQLAQSRPSPENVNDIIGRLGVVASGALVPSSRSASGPLRGHAVRGGRRSLKKGWPA